MPLAVFVTNVDVSSTMEEIATGLSHILADRLHREEEKITVHIHPNQFMLRGGSTDPAGYISLCTSRGFGDVEHRRETSQKILDFIKEHLKLKNASRFMVYMHTMSADDIGVDGGLVSDRFGCMGQGGPFDVRWHKLTK
ncbi:macrophage migration inhibitory factor-like [Lytechinus variegatus]|uniref:macrophage migration inhibitory factor-like n=1 Tax=Lytechinus variegatus TaxID=7654 RepID=UPI001BB2A19E|nr:macrophage migration inhibitory factor-like [Lytechinus variegatus]